MCDHENNIYLQTDREVVLDADFTGIRKISPSGERLATLTADSALGFQVSHPSYFAIAKDGRVYEATYLAESFNRALLVFDKDGKYATAIKLDPPPGFIDWLPGAVAVFGTGDFLISGAKMELKTHDRLPFTAIYGQNGALKKELTLSDDEEIRRMVEAGDSRVSPTGLQGQNMAVEMGQAEAAEDGNVYLMRRLSPAILYAIAPSGQVVRRFVVDPGDPAYIPSAMHIAGSRIALLFRDDSTQQEIMKVADLEGNELANYKIGTNKRGYSEFGSFACYSVSPERFTFISTAENGHTAFEVVEPH